MPETQIGEPIMRTAIFYLFLRPLILANYWMRERKLLSDKWFWADATALSWGFTVNI